MRKTCVVAALGILLLCSAEAKAQCPSVNPMYRDLEEWVHGTNNGLFGQVTITNPSQPDGSHYFTAWGKSCVMQGVGGFGQCKLTTNPTVLLLYSDRTEPSTAPDITPEHTLRNVNQPFSVKKYDMHVVSLDMVANTILSRSKTWNFDVTYTNVRRSGDVVYADNGGSVIVLNLSRIHWTGNVMPACGDW